MTHAHDTPDSWLREWWNMYFGGEELPLAQGAHPWAKPVS